MNCQSRIRDRTAAYRTQTELLKLKVREPGAEEDRKLDLTVAPLEGAPPADAELEPHDPDLRNRD